MRDVTYDQQQLIDEKFAGAHQDFKMAKDTYGNIKSYAAKKHTIYMPAYNNDASLRLSNDIFWTI